jgi:hypothetical protein
MSNVPLTSDLPPSILREIGRICVAYSRIEWLLNKTIYDVLNVSTAEGRLAVRDPAPDQRVELIEDLMALNGIKPTVERIGDLKSFLKEAKTKRDALAHGVWLRPDGGTTLYLRLINGTWTPPGTTGKIKRRMMLEGFPFTLEEAREWTELVQTTFKAVQIFHAKIINEMNRMVASGELPDKRPEPSPRQNRTRGQTGDKPPRPPRSSRASRRREAMKKHQKT